MKKSALMIRNVSGITPEEVVSVISLCKFKTPLTINDASPAKVKQFQTLINEGRTVPPELIKDKDVRDYIFESAKANTGNLLILHQNYNTEAGTQDYILNKLNSVEPDQHFSAFYLGGGHGGGHGGRIDDETSGLQKATVKAIAKKLGDENVTIGAGVFGSCYSAAFANDFRGRLIPEGVMLGDAVECGSNNGFSNLATWLGETDNKPFFTATQVRESRVKVSDTRTQFNELVGNDKGVADRNLVRAYIAHTNHTGPAPTVATVEGLLRGDRDLKAAVEARRTDMLDAEITAYSRDIARLGPTPSTQQLKDAAARYPMVSDALTNGAYILKSDVPAFSLKLQREVDAFIKARNPKADDDITDDLMRHLEAQCTTQAERNQLKVFDYVRLIEGSSSPDDYRDLATNYTARMERDYNPEDSHGPQLKAYTNEAALYKGVVVATKQDMVTSRAISTPTRTHVFALTPDTGKPPHTCVDAYDRVGLVMDAITSTGGTVVVERDMGTYNQASVMTGFNDLFSTAAVASDKLLALVDLEDGIDADAIELDDIQIDLLTTPTTPSASTHTPSAPPPTPHGVEQSRAMKGQLDKIKGDATPAPTPTDDHSSTHQTGL